ncbi:MAG: hypothetical protein J7502_08330 [Flavisolibacter sp.]|nr:hypothetical protein [Flavisolibacter sp.]
MTTTQLTPSTARQYLLNDASLEVKMFVYNQPKDAEKAVSQWLKENDVTIHHIVQSQSEKNGNFVFVITLFFVQND